MSAADSTTGEMTWKNSPQFVEESQPICTETGHSLHGVNKNVVSRNTTRREI
jgi:TPP-dependent 2-oxoacid decarboxylase